MLIMFWVNERNIIMITIINDNDNNYILKNNAILLYTGITLFDVFIMFITWRNDRIKDETSGI